jgi:hypothetical protein
MKINLIVECNHPEINHQKNIECDLIEPIDDFHNVIAAVYQCPVCKRQIVISLGTD